MSDHAMSKAEKLAEGKKKLKKFQSKNKPPKAKEENESPILLQSEIFEEKEKNVPANEIMENSTESLPNASQLFAGGGQNEHSLFGGAWVPNHAAYFSDLTIPGGQKDEIRETQPAANFDQIASLQSKSFDNLSQLSDKFAKLESEIGSGSQPHANFTFNADNTQELEERHNELNRKFEEERQKTQKLEIRLREQYSNVDTLKLELQKLEMDNSTKLNAELGPLRDQLDNHIRTVAVLVGEKAELTAAVSAYESLGRNREQEKEELLAKLTASRHQVQELKQEIGTLKKSLEKFDNSQQNLCSEVENSRDELKALKTNYEDASEEIAELKRRLELKTQEFAALESHFQEKSQELNFAQLRLTQLATPEDDQMMRDRMIEATAQQRIVLEEQIQELLRQVEKANSERETAANHYQNYVQQLNKEREALIGKVHELSRERDELTKRDADLVRHVGDLEKQIQQQIHLQSKMQPQESRPVSDSKEISDMVVKLENEKEVLQEKLAEEKGNVFRISDLLKSREERIQELENETERLRHSHVDPLQITATLESEKVAASRAMSQNQDLRAQLEEMQRAFVHMTNDKATLMTELDAERYLAREIRNKYEEWDTELKSLRQKLHFKDEEMMRLAHESTEQQRRILTLSQELDQLRHLEMNKQNQSHLQVEIQKQREQILKLQAMIRQKQDEVQKMDKNEDEEDSRADVSVAEEVNEELIAGIEEQIMESPNVVEVTQILPTEEAMYRLQERFTKTMSEIADLTDEKQRLEHLVIQLQGETETIGEYIALYQSQRKLLKQKEIEKDIQVQKITADREDMKDKLLKLNSLVELMLKQRSGDAVTENGVKSPENGVEPQPNPVYKDSSKRIQQNSNSQETAEEILNLLTEIKTSNMNTNFLTVSDHVQTCSCCSGQLITV